MNKQNAGYSSDCLTKEMITAAHLRKICLFPRAHAVDALETRQFSVTAIKHSKINYNQVKKQ